MAVGSIEFFSQCLRRNVSFKVVMANEDDPVGEEAKPLKVLMLLHGYCGGNSEWLWHGNMIELAQTHHLCIILPAGENSFYLDGEATGRQYGTFIGEELLQTQCIPGMRPYLRG